MVELVAVLVIIATMAAIAQPRLVDFYVREELRSAARRIESDIRLTQAEAIRGRIFTVMDFDHDAEAYLAFHHSNDTDPPTFQALADPLHRKSVLCGHLPTDCGQGVNLIDADFDRSSHLVFDQHGFALQGGTVTIGSDTYQLTIEVAQGSGKVTINEIIDTDTRMSGSNPDPPNFHAWVVSGLSPTDFNINGADAMLEAASNSLPTRSVTDKVTRDDSGGKDPGLLDTVGDLVGGILGGLGK